MWASRRHSRRTAIASVCAGGPAAEVIRGERGGPSARPEELEHAAEVGPAIVVGIGGDARDYGLERGVGFGRGEPLGRAVVGNAEHTDAAVAPGLGRYPVYRVEAVLSLVYIRIPVAIGDVPAPGVLDYDGVAPVQRAHGVKVHTAVARRVLAVGDALEKDRVASRARRAVHVGAENHAVAHGNLHVGLGRNGGGAAVFVFDGLGDHVVFSLV